MAPRFCGTKRPAAAVLIPGGCDCCVSAEWVAQNFDLEALAEPDDLIPPPPLPTSSRRLRPSPAAGDSKVDGKADVIFTARSIISVEPGDDGLAEAVASIAGRIVAVGPRDTVSAQWQGPRTRVVDFGEASIVPGFVEPHMHPLMWGTFSEGVDCSAEACNGSHSEMLERLAAASAQAPEGAWIRAWNYEYSDLDAGRPVTRTELDSASGGCGRKVVIDDRSGHVFFVSTTVFEEGGVDPSNPPEDPPGGVFVREANGSVTAEVQENAKRFVTLPKRGKDDLLRAGRFCSEKLLQLGVTTATDAGCGNIGGKQDYLVYDKLAAEDGPGVRYVVMPTLAGAAATKAAKNGEPPITSFLPLPPVQNLGDRFKIGPQKLISDGSIQRFTAFLNPSTTTGRCYVHHSLPEGHNGKPLLDADQLAAAVLAVHSSGSQVAVHANGDAALDITLDAIEAALEKVPRADHRHRVEHCQLPSEAQLDRIARLGVCPSFFTNHVYYWGSWHCDATVGPERAACMDPLASAEARGIRWSTHCDAPVTAPSPLFSIWAAANRRTRAGVTLGEAQRVSPAAALRAVTLDAAFQVFADDDRGSLRAGKFCDLAVLGRDPTLLDDESVSSIRHIPIVATVLGAEVAWSAAVSAL